MSGGPVAVIAWDACDATTALELAEAGALPTLRSLLPRARRATSMPPFGVHVGAIWPSVATGLDAGHHRFTCWNTVDVATYELRLTHPREMQGTPFWRALSDAGRKVAVIDFPHALLEPVEGVMVVEWGNHDRHIGLQGWPDGIVDELIGSFGLHPVFGVEPFSDRQFCPDDYVYRAGDIRTDAEQVALLTDTLLGAELKHRLSLALLERGDWDLFFSVFGESHPAGHHLWHSHDRSHPRHDPAWADRHGDGVSTVYRALDDSLAEHLAALGPSTTTLVFLSHGMGPHNDATHLLDEMLRRIDAVEADGPLGHPASRAAKALWSALPDGVRRTAAPIPAAAGRLVGRRRGLATSWHPSTASSRSSQRFFLEPNNAAIGGVRVNLAGREPDGLVPPEDFDIVRDRLRRDLLDLVNVETGRRVVREVHRTESHLDRWAGDELPDLLVEWDYSSEVRTVWSPKVGLLHGPYGLWRTGDHIRPDGLLLAVGPDIEPGEADPIEHVDLAPSICARLGVEMPGVDGKVVDWIAG